MRVDLERGHIQSYEQIAKEANESNRNAKKAKTIEKDAYERALLQKNTSAENKKRRLVKLLHQLIISAFSLNTSNAKAKRIGHIKENADLIRKVIHKIKSINNYLEEVLLREMGIIKKSLVVEALKSRIPEKYLQKSRKLIQKEDINRIEHIVYELMQKIIFLDKQLIKDYKKKEVKIVNTENMGASELENILKIETEIIDALEAKIPPSSRVKAKLLQKEIFNAWIPMVFALLSSFEAEYKKEMQIFLEIKKNKKLRKKIEGKISHIIEEKEKLLKIKEKRALAMKNFSTAGNDYRQILHEYVSAASM
ncbi:hypothetical protein HYX01_02690 [Candidatus Woesearchaeota archaeon]|nr:hypothetical protein [Candidatus Woesearchaeota archaeon]